MVWFIAVYVLEYALLYYGITSKAGIILWFSAPILGVLFLALGLLMPKKAE